MAHKIYQRFRQGSRTDLTPQTQLWLHGSNSCRSKVHKGHHSASQIFTITSVNKVTTSSLISGKALPLLKTMSETGDWRPISISLAVLDHHPHKTTRSLGRCKEAARGRSELAAIRDKLRSMASRGPISHRINLEDKINMACRVSTIHKANTERTTSTTARTTNMVMGLVSHNCNTMANNMLVKVHWLHYRHYRHHGHRQHRHHWRH